MVKLIVKVTISIVRRNYKFNFHLSTFISGISPINCISRDKNKRSNSFYRRSRVD